MRSYRSINYNKQIIVSYNVDFTKISRNGTKTLEIEGIFINYPGIHHTRDHQSKHRLRPA